MPGSLLSQYSLSNGRSVPSRWVTRNCSGVRRDSASGFLLYLGINPISFNEFDECSPVADLPFSGAERKNRITENSEPPVTTVCFDDFDDAGRNSYPPLESRSPRKVTESAARPTPASAYGFKS